MHELYFPVQKEPAETVLAALLPGKLVVDDNGCLRVGNALILWPYGYSLQTEGKDIWVVDNKEMKMARVGDEVKIIGGFIPEDVAIMKIGNDLPAECQGPFWLAGGRAELDN